MKSTKHFKNVAAFAVSCLLITSATAQPVVVEGIKFDPVNTVADKQIVLNGAGLRSRLVFKIYAAALYLPAKTTSADAAIKMDGAKRVRITIMRELDTNDFGKLFVSAIKRNVTPTEFIPMINGTMEMGRIFSAAKNPFKPGDTILLDYIPGKGTTITINDRVMGSAIVEPEFYSGLMRIWLGKEPADTTLKANMLGNMENISKSVGPEAR